MGVIKFKMGIIKFKMGVIKFKMGIFDFKKWGANFILFFKPPEKNFCMPNRLREEAKEKKSQIIAAYQSGGDWRELKERLGVSDTTAYRWISEGLKEDKRGGKRYNKILEEHKNFMVEEIEKNPRITLEEIKMGIGEKFNLGISKESIRNHLDNMLYTLKDIRYEPERGNCDENKLKRKEFAVALLEYQSSSLPIVFMDETNFNLHISRGHGRSLSGKRCTVVAAGSKGANIHLIGAISDIGLVHHEIRRGSFRKEEARVWIKECLRQSRIKHGGSWFS